MDPILGEVRLFAGNYAPRGWAFCDGQLLSIQQNMALFSLLGTTYGGNGTTTFALPDLRGRSPVGEGQGPGLSPNALGQMSGRESVTLTQANLPAHSHTLNASSDGGTTSSPANAVLAASPTRDNQFAPTANTVMNGQAVGMAGQSQPVSTRSPYLVMHYIIALQGIYPSRN